GGMGEISGAVLGGLLLGLIEAAVPAEYSGYKEAVAFALLFLVLMVRPQGLLGRRPLEKL
ncbi:MAG: branched-chain amino acid ABC transporter permease LivH, partial [Pseudobdellovibrionaceae bacterium]|nr:branched-chain amino acid ABC transporter permease LivH [Pseudobdellovibrionaceae bacterium]